ncbi:hypothetical protein BQ8482_400035 [Mesorhizobium delmotii]|uniref:Uncharacterized protein n=1 Tax=Mesorhizobium delmotii TaxID=1631247 RepID=A0A2P9AT25_9HYPH|nr:hypothetical protein BQ8482_400035 [Mesorhizobium delmotii]
MSAPCAVRQFRKRHGRAPARYWINIPRSGIHGLLKLALKRWPPELATTDAGVCDQYLTGCGRIARWPWPRSTL